MIFVAGQLARDRDGNAVGKGDMLNDLVKTQVASVPSRGS